MQFNHYHLKATQYARYINTCDSMFRYIKKYIKVPLYKHFNMAPNQFHEFENRVLSKEPNIKDFEHLIAIYTSLQSHRLLDIYNDAFGEELPF